MKEQNQDNRFSGMTREEVIQEAKKQIVHSAVLALAALIVIGVACYAWFVSSDTVTARVGTVLMEAAGFDLASKGEPGVFDDKMPTIYSVTGETWEGGTRTLPGEMREILWRMSDASNLGNQPGESAGDGIRPGSFGKMEFYVIPRQAGDLTLAFELEIIPLKNVYTTDNNGTTNVHTEIVNDPVVRNFLRGHLLFDYSYGDQSGLVSTEMNDGAYKTDFTVMLTNPGKQEKITLDWLWPKRMEDAQNHEGVPGLMQEHSELFFNNGSASIEGVSEKVLSDYYDDADQYIGENVDWIILRMSAKMQ